MTIVLFLALFNNYMGVLVLANQTQTLTAVIFFYVHLPLCMLTMVYMVINKVAVKY